MTVDDEKMLKETDQLLNECLRLNYLSVGIELQEEAVAKLDALVAVIEKRRNECVAARSEAEANRSWIAGCYVEGMKELMRMWIHCKKDEMEAAWDALVTAQGRFETALQLRFDEGFDRLNRNLHALELLLFPPCVFVSSSILIERFDCSICGSEYGECDHLAMKLYMGELCVKVVKNICGVDHVAIVRDPEDKRLRFPALVNGKDLCSLTYRSRVIPERGDEGADANH